MNFKQLIEDFTDISGKKVEHPTIDDNAPTRTLANEISSGDANRLALAASHPNALYHHLNSALDHGGLDQIVGAHPNTPLRYLKRILDRSEDKYARIAASHNHNMTPSTLAKAYEEEKDPEVKVQMLRSRHMPKEILDKEFNEEMDKQYPDHYKIESITSNINSPHRSVNLESIARINKTAKHGGYLGGEYKERTGEKSTNKVEKEFSKLSKVLSSEKLADKTSLHGIKIDHSYDPENHTLTLTATHDLPDDVTHIAGYNKSKDEWSRIHNRFKEVIDHPDVKEKFETTSMSMSPSKANSLDKARTGKNVAQYTFKLHDDYK